MIADRWELIGEGLLIDSTGDRWIRGLTRFWRRPKRCLQIDMLFLERRARRHASGSQKRVIVACESSRRTGSSFQTSCPTEKHTQHVLRKEKHLLLKSESSQRDLIRDSLEAAMTAVPEQVITTPAAVELMAMLEAKHGELMFHQSGGCCDGSSPMCYPRGEFLVGDQDVLLATIVGIPFYMSRSQFEYWKHTQLILDVVPGRGGMFSLENGEGVRFLIRSRVFDDGEIAALRAAGRI